MAAVSGPSASLQAWFASRSQKTGVGAGVEELALTKLMLAGVYKRQIGDQEELNIVSAVPEVGWLVECLCRSPLPPGWRKSKVAPGDVPLYCCEATGDVSETSSNFTYYVRLAELVMHARQSPDKASTAASWVRAVVKEVRTLADGLSSTWTGPYVDNATGNEYYHCPSTGIASWEDPSAWARFVDGVAEQLLKSEAFRGTGIARNPSERDASKKSRASKSKSGKTNSTPKDIRESSDDRVWSALDQLDESTMPPACPWAALDDLDSLAVENVPPPADNSWMSMQELIKSDDNRRNARSDSKTTNPHPEDDEQAQMAGDNAVDQGLCQLQGSVASLEQQIAELKGLTSASANSTQQDAVAPNSGVVLPAGLPTLAPPPETPKTRPSTAEVAPAVVVEPSLSGPPPERNAATKEAPPPPAQNAEVNSSVPSVPSENAPSSPADKAVEPPDSIKSLYASLPDGAEAKRDLLAQWPSLGAVPTAAVVTTPSETSYTAHPVSTAVPLAKSTAQEQATATGGYAASSQPAIATQLTPAPDPRHTMESRTHVPLAPQTTMTPNSSTSAEGGYAAASQPIAASSSASTAPPPAAAKQLPVRPSVQATANPKQTAKATPSAASTKKLAKMPVSVNDKAPDKVPDNAAAGSAAPRSTPTASEKPVTAAASQPKAPVRLAAMPVVSDKVSQRQEKIADTPVADDINTWAADASAQDGKPSASTPSVAVASENAPQARTAQSQPPAEDQRPKWHDKYADVADADDMDQWAADASARDDKPRKAAPPPAVPKESKLHDKFAHVTVADDMDEWAADIKEAPQRAELVGLAERLEQLPPGAPSSTVLSLLEAIERIPATFEDLQVTRLGVLTQPYKDSTDMQVRTVVKRLRHAWKQTLKDTVT